MHIYVLNYRVVIQHLCVNANSQDITHFSSNNIYFTVTVHPTIATVFRDNIDDELISLQKYNVNAS